MSSECKWCKITFESVQELRMVRPAPLQGSSQANHGQKHLKVDVDSHYYYCQQCKRTLQGYNGLKHHYRSALKHRNQGPADSMLESESYCVHCRRQFISSQRLLVHIATAHETDVQCEMCGTLFPYRSNLESHMASPVHNERNIPCPHCPRLLKTTSGVAHHLEYSCLRKITDTVVQWDVEHQITDPVFTNRIREVGSDDDDDDILVIKKNQGLEQILNVLVTADTWDNTLRAYVCPVDDCMRKFRKLGDLNQHLRSQKHRTDPSTFRCPKCESRFSVVSALIQHLESGACGLTGLSTVQDIYRGLQDMFKKLLKF